MKASLRVKPRSRDGFSGCCFFSIAGKEGMISALDGLKTSYSTVPSCQPRADLEKFWWVLNKSLFYAWWIRLYKTNVCQSSSYLT